MHHLIRLKTITSPLLMTLTLLCFGLSPTAKALLPPPAPDGGYPGGNTAEGQNALQNVNTAVGINNTAVGFNALTSDTTGAYNVAIGSGALQDNIDGFQNMAIGAEALANNITGNFNMDWFSIALYEHRQPKQRCWRCSAQEQPDRFGQYRHWFHCDEREHYRRIQHGHWFGCTVVKYNQLG